MLFLRTGVLLWNQISPDWRDISKIIFTEICRTDSYLRLFQKWMTLLLVFYNVEVDTLTHS